MGKQCKREHCVGCIQEEDRDYCSGMCKSIDLAMLRIVDKYRDANHEDYREHLTSCYSALEEAGKWLTEYRRLTEEHRHRVAQRRANR